LACSVLPPKKAKKAKKKSKKKANKKKAKKAKKQAKKKANKKERKKYSWETPELDRYMETPGLNKKGYSNFIDDTPDFDGGVADNRFIDTTLNKYEPVEYINQIKITPKMYLKGCWYGCTFYIVAKKPEDRVTINVYRHEPIRVDTSGKGIDVKDMIQPPVVKVP
jgi:hypothetical protein